MPLVVQRKAIHHKLESKHIIIVYQLKLKVTHYNWLQDVDNYKAYFIDNISIMFS